MKSRNLTEQPVITSIERTALSTKYSASQIDGIMEIAFATGNPRLAIEIALDLYQEPTFQEYGIVRTRGEQKAECRFVRFDKWTDKVWYEYDDEQYKEFRIDKDTDTSLITLDNYEEYKVDYNHNNSKWFSLPTGQTKVVTDSTSPSNYWSMVTEWADMYQLSGSEM
jgi:hypothetical protein